ncbi:MAG: hypothetical protein II956_11660 [Bacteroidales bacterium]|nr:hypothetical protein [Bacteroidales bacterium]
MKKITLLVIVFFAIMQFSCKDDEPLDGTTFSKSFIQVYRNADSIDIKLESNDTCTLPMFIVYFSGEDCSIGDSVKFNNIAAKNNDISYNKNLVPYSNIVVYDTLTAISVVCSQDFSSKYTHGVNLSEIINFCSFTPYNFIQNGYKYTNLKRQSDIGLRYDYGYEPIDCVSSEIHTQQVKCFAPYCYFYFTEHPSISGTYTFEVTIKLSEKTLKNTVTMEF